MDSMSDLLSQLSASQEPPEIARIKQFVADQFQASAHVATKGEVLIITVASAALANMLRLRTVQLREAAQTTKRLVFRIG